MQVAKSFAEPPFGIQWCVVPIRNGARNDLLALIAIQNPVPWQYATAVEILEIVNGICYVVRPIHQIGLGSLGVVGEKLASKTKVVSLGLVRSPFLRASCNPGIPKPRVFEAGCECCSRQIKTWTFVKPNSQLRENAKGLRVPFKSVVVIAFDKLMQDMFPHVTEWRMT